jgi:hypothetical protein
MFRDAGTSKSSLRARRRGSARRGLRRYTFPSRPAFGAMLFFNVDDASNKITLIWTHIQYEGNTNITLLLILVFASHYD